MNTRPAPRVTYVGHATTLIEMDGVRLLTDPVLRRRIGPLVRQVGEPDLEGLSAIDAILVSHLHLDHLDFPSLRLLSSAAPLVVPRGAARLLARRGFADVHELDVGNSLCVGPVHIVATPAQHDGGRHPYARPKSGLGYVISGALDVYFAGDTALFPEMEGLWPDLDIALLPVSGWGPTLPEADHMSPLLAARALELLRPRMAIPIHWGTYLVPGLDLLFGRGPRGGDETEAIEFGRHAYRHTPQVRTILLHPGETCDFAGTQKLPFSGCSEGEVTGRSLRGIHAGRRP